MSETTDKKLLENPFVSSLVVPIAIVLVGALIIFGVTKMISTDRSYKDLVREMHSKTFGNRWVAAYELSKQISSSSIPEEDIPWLIENLSDIYTNSIDARTRDFIIVALGALRDKRALKIINTGLQDEDKNVKFHSVIALANIEDLSDYEWGPVQDFLNSKDLGMVHSSILALATHKVPQAEEQIVSKLEHEEKSIRFAAATGLIYYKNSKASDLIREILFLDAERATQLGFDSDKLYGLKMNVLSALAKTKWKLFTEDIEKLSVSEKNLKVVSKAKETLNLLKK